MAEDGGAATMLAPAERTSPHSRISAFARTLKRRGVSVAASYAQHRARNASFPRTCCTRICVTAKGSSHNDENTAEISQRKLSKRNCRGKKIKHGSSAAKKLSSAAAKSTAASESETENGVVTVAMASIKWWRMVYDIISSSGMPSNHHQAKLK